MFYFSGGQGNGVFDVADNDTVFKFITNIYTFKARATFPGPGTVAVENYGNVVFLGVPIDPPSIHSVRKFKISNIRGTLTIPEAQGELTVTERLTYSGGLITGSGLLNTGPECLLMIDGSEDKQIEQTTINIAGRAVWSGPGNINTSKGAEVNILSGGELEIQNNQVFDGTLEDTPSLNVMDGGTIRKTQGAGDSIIGLNSNNDGLREFKRVPGLKCQAWPATLPK